MENKLHVGQQKAIVSADSGWDICDRNAPSMQIAVTGITIKQNTWLLYIM